MCLRLSDLPSPVCNLSSLVHVRRTALAFQRFISCVVAWGAVCCRVMPT